MHETNDDNRREGVAIDCIEHHGYSLVWVLQLSQSSGGNLESKHTTKEREQMQEVKNVRRRETVRLGFRHENEESVDVEEV